MDNKDKIQGLWWLSDKPENKVSGELLIEERKLELNGTLEGAKSLVSMGNPKKFIGIQKDKYIFGISQKGNKSFTLEFYDEPTSISITMPGYQSDTYSLGNIFEGVHLNPKCNGFSKYYVELPYLFDWAGIGIISSTFHFSSNQKTIEKAVINIGSIKEVNLYRGNDYKITYVIRPDKFPLSISQETTISQRCYLEIESLNKKVSLANFYDLVFHFTRFLSIAVGCSLEPLCYQARSDTQQGGLAQIFPHFYKKRDYKSIHALEMLFTLSDFGNDLQEILDKWFSQREKYSDVFDLFSAINSGSNKNLNNQFNDIISAIEGYVRIEKNQFELSLDKCVKILNETLPENSRPFTKSDYNKIRVTRNKIAHVALRPGEENYLLDNKEKYIYLQKLKFLLEYYFLRIIGLENNLLDKFFQNKRRLFL